MGSTSPLLQVVHSLYPQSRGEIEQYAGDVARALGGWVLSLTPQPDPAPDAWDGLRVLSPAAGEGLISAWHRALDTAQPGAVFVQHLGALSPSLLLDLRDRNIPYAVFLHDFAPLCPTLHLWHRDEQRCSGPGRTGWKCAWCVSGSLRRAAELPLRTVLYRHRPQDWRTALVRADALVASSRFARDFWVQRGAPPERIAVISPWLGRRNAAAVAASRLDAERRSVVFAGGPGHANGAELLGAALDQMQEPLQVDVVGNLDEPAQAQLRSTLAERHWIVFHPPDALPALAAGGRLVVVPPRWEQPFSRLIAQAQAVGTRVVATAVGGLGEQIIHGVNGFLATPDDPRSLAEALRDAFDDDQPAWAGDLVARNAQIQGQASAEALRTLLDLMARGQADPDPALVVEHGVWLAQRGVSVSEAAQNLAQALRQGDEPGPEYQQRAFATTHRRLMELNHAVAFFRGCGCRRVASASDDSMEADAVEYFTTWGLEVVAARELPDGLWFEGEEVDTDLLQRRFPQARALVAILPGGVETLDWTADVSEE